VAVVLQLEHERDLWGAKVAARIPWIACVVRMSSYECGMDQPTYTPVQQIIERSGTLFFSFQDLDSTKPSGSVKIRVETITHYLEKYAGSIIEKKRAATRRAARSCRRRRPAQAIPPRAEVVAELAIRNREHRPPVRPRIGVEREAPEEFEELRAAVLSTSSRPPGTPAHTSPGSRADSRLGPGRAAGERLEVREELDRGRRSEGGAYDRTRCSRSERSASALAEFPLFQDATQILPEGVFGIASTNSTSPGTCSWRGGP